MITIAITVAWFAVVMIYLMAAGDRRTNCY